MAKELRDALYRARATMAEASQTASKYGDPYEATNTTLGFSIIDRSMQAGVEDADRVLIEYEQTNIFTLSICKKCGAYELPSDEEEPYCCFEPMEKVQVERMD